METLVVETSAKQCPRCGGRDTEDQGWCTACNYHWPPDYTLRNITWAVEGRIALNESEDSIAKKLVESEGWSEETAIGFVKRVSQERQRHPLEESDDPWWRFAAEVGGRCIDKRCSNILVTVDGWKVSLELVGERGVRRRVLNALKREFEDEVAPGFREFTTYMRASARLESNRSFGFSIHKYAESPDPEIVVNGDDQSTVRALLESGTLRDLIRSQPYLDLRFDRSMVSRLLGSRKAKLELSEWGQITDVEHLKSLLTYFVEMLNEMHRLRLVSAPPDR